MRFQSLEAFRGLAAVFVIFFHSLFATSTLSTFRMNSYLFVDFFFILSGFIISYSYLNRIQTGEVESKVFLLKRIFRLYPLHLFMLMIWLVYIFLKHEAFERHIGGQDPFDTHTLTSFIEHFFLVQSWGTENIMAWNVPSWSISVEILAYILFVVFALSFQNATNIMKLFISFFFVVFFKLLLYAHFDSLKNFEFLLNGLSAFFIGIIIYIIYSYKTKTSYPSLLVNSIEIGLMLVIFLLLNANVHSPMMLNVVQLVFALTIYFFAIQEQGIISKILQYKAFQYLGLLSYSIYMIHALILEVFGHIFEYLLHFPTSFEGKRKVLITDYADLINFLIIILIIVLSHFTYTFIEQAARKKLNSKL